jgi:hypothetical protein
MFLAGWLRENIRGDNILHFAGDTGGFSYDNLVSPDSNTAGTQRPQRRQKPSLMTLNQTSIVAQRCRVCQR